MRRRFHLVLLAGCVFFGSCSRETSPTATRPAPALAVKVVIETDVDAVREEIANDIRDQVESALEEKGIPTTRDTALLPLLKIDLSAHNAHGVEAVAFAGRADLFDAVVVERNGYRFVTSIWSGEIVGGACDPNQTPGKLKASAKDLLGQFLRQGKTRLTP